MVDPGRYTYADDGDNDGDGWRHWFKGTAAHNTVTVDGLDQTPYRAGKPEGPHLAGDAARTLERLPGLDVLPGEVVSPSYDAGTAARWRSSTTTSGSCTTGCAAASAHTYVARWHLCPDAQGRTSVFRRDRQTTVRAPGLTLIVPRWCGEVTIEDGWVSPTYGVKLPAPVVVITAADVVDADLVTVILVGDAPTQVTARCSGQEAAVLVDRPGIGRDRVRCGAAP